MANDIYDRALFRRLRRLADGAAPRVQAQVERALMQLQAAVPVAQLERILASRDAFALHDLVSSLPKRLQPAVDTLQHVFVRGNDAGRAALSGPIKMRFDARNPLASQAARESGAKFVTAVTAETRKAIRTVVSRAFTEGITVPEIAQLVKPLIGLTPRQAQAAAARYEQRISAGASRTAARAASKAYGAQLLRRRSRLIARTEVIRASTEGQLAAWTQAQQTGLLSARARKVWIVTADDRLCPACAPLDGATATMGGTFKSGLFSEVTGPPLHPACRCAIGVTFEDSGRPSQTPPQEMFSRPSSSYPVARKRGDTLERFTRADGTLTPERSRLHRAITERFLAKHVAQAKPTTIFMGGGPAAGKSNLMRVIKTPRDVVHIDPDEVKKLLPEFGELAAKRDVAASTIVHEESSVLAKQIAAEAKLRRYNVLNDGTGNGSYTNMAGKVEKARQEGRRIVAHYVTVDTDTAIARALERGAKTGRYVPEEYIRQIHASVSRVLPEAITNGLFDEVTLWDTTGSLVTKVATAKGKTLIIHNQKLWDAFVAKGL